MSHSTNYQPIDTVKAGIEKVLPTAYLIGIVLVYIASAAVMAFLLYPSFLKVIGSPEGAIIAAGLLCTSIQMMRFLIVFTDSLTKGANDSGAIIKAVSLLMLVLSIFEVFHAGKAIGAATAIALSTSALMVAGCVLELLFVAKLNRRDTELEQASQSTSQATSRSSQRPNGYRGAPLAPQYQNGTVHP